jgi:hypothetical protein
LAWIDEVPDLLTNQLNKGCHLSARLAADAGRDHHPTKYQAATERMLESILGTGYVDSYVAFMDILGFSALTEPAEYTRPNF